MKYIRLYWDSTLLLCLTWCVLNENFSIITIVTGLIASILTVFLVRLLFSGNDDIKNYRVRPYLMVWYFVVLFYHIVHSGISTIGSIIRHETDPVVVELHTSVHNHWFQCLIANSITLTPGTITIDKTDHKLRVLWLYPTTDDKEKQADIIFGPFERLLKKGDFKK